ncbi:S8 family peptidase [bacterium SCSIO 12741]|nr:S8 family peptidase [bacterium SCSIO 12741]
MKHFWGIVLGLALAFSGFAQDRVKGELLIALEADENLLEAIEAINETYPQLSLNPKEVISPELGIHSLSFNEQVVEAMPDLPKIIAQHPWVRMAQWNHTGIQVRKSPNDPQYIAQWHWTQIGAEDAWSMVTGGMTKNGKEIVIAIVDDGYELNHDDLKDNWWKNKHEIPFNQIDDDSNGYVDDYDGFNFYEDTGHIHTFNNRYTHGTRVAGIIGARSNNNLDVAGANWQVKMMPVIGSSTTESTVLKSYNYVLKMRMRYNRTNGDSGAFIVACNSSFGVDFGNPADYPLWCDMYNQMGEVGILSIASAPNVAINIDEKGDVPCTCPSDYLVTVTRTDQNDNLKSAGYGTTHMDMAAPGVEILTTFPNNSTTKTSGASFSTAMVTGAIGLMYAALPDTIFDQLSPKDLTARMKGYLLSEGVEVIPALNGMLVTDGRLDMHGAVNAAYNDYQVGVGEHLRTHEILIYPNPANDRLVLQSITPLAKPLQLSVVNLQGQEVIRTEWKTDGQLVIETADWPEGMYLVRLQDNSASEAYRIMITHR